jgi:deoxyuridine 5'-triphosphate nucleotidohydrolase
MFTREQFGHLVLAHREHRRITREQLAASCSISVDMLVDLERGRAFPAADVLDRICLAVELPETISAPWLRPSSQLRLRFEESLSELVGRSLDLSFEDEPSLHALEQLISRLFDGMGPDEAAHDRLQSVLVFYGVPPVSRPFFQRYLGAAAFASVDAFRDAVKRYQKDAMRLFSSFAQAFGTLAGADDLDARLAALGVRDLNSLMRRPSWDVIEKIADEDLPNLGYVVASQVRSEQRERTLLRNDLIRLADSIDKEGPQAVRAMDGKTSRRIDTLLRKFDSTMRHGVMSSLFVPDSDELRREAERLGAKDENSIRRMEATQGQAGRNLARYLSADVIDVYVATSMRVDADFVSVNDFVETLFIHSDVEQLHLRYFNPTQSWVEDRMAKGLVEALMLKRASVTIYMAQKSDTFGKDSEASVALGQGKPVIVYVPKLRLEDGSIDSEELFRLGHAELVRCLGEEDPGFDGDGEADDEALLAQLLLQRLRAASDAALIATVRTCWADFDLYGEAARLDESVRGTYRRWLDEVRCQRAKHVPRELREGLAGILVATSIRFEKRAKVFREIHPLALQIILSTGVLNGILVARSVEQCARVLRSLMANSLSLEIMEDAHNYRLVEKDTGSTVRVISRHTLLGHAFQHHFPGKAEGGHADVSVPGALRGPAGLRVFLTPEAVAAGLEAPRRAYDDDAGFDLRLLATEPLVIPPHQHRPVPTGVGFDIPTGWYGLICNRTSGGKRGLLPLAQVVDANFTGSLTLTLHNTNADAPIELQPGERVAQIVFMPTWPGSIARIEPDLVKHTERGAKAYGSSGKT